MRFMPWTDDFLTGIQKIDEQHRWLVDKTNDLHDEITKAEPDRQAIGGILLSLVEYAIDHFIVEEDLFKRYAYPHEAAHLGEHDLFNKTATELLSKHESGTTVNEEAMNFLKNWLAHHILTVDKAYVSFFKAHEIS